MFLTRIEDENHDDDRNSEAGVGGLDNSTLAERPFSKRRGRSDTVAKDNRFLGMAPAAPK